MFQQSTAFKGFTQPTAVRFSPDGRVFVAEKSGMIKVFAWCVQFTTHTIGSLVFGEQGWRAEWERHTDAVRRYFSGRPDFLELDLTSP